MNNKFEWVLCTCPAISHRKTFNNFMVYFYVSTYPHIVMFYDCFEECMSTACALFQQDTHTAYSTVAACEQQYLYYFRVCEGTGPTEPSSNNRDSNTTGKTMPRLPAHQGLGLHFADCGMTHSSGGVGLMGSKFTSRLHNVVLLLYIQYNLCICTASTHDMLFFM